ncbi:MAG TPA: UDP-N-acetylglucosamine--N-acetylmuramyl-(pentapeptide) pyrophosphoryl-undecaprenol N-acetylglucosamine transferase, partial [Actinobacteria bacterium]|nr:UDP-N-acetylglucosamine--N-acetylmuramyl-(pentapeptide) pyrophosphoryl-undecaprenol N-acetylglucosamine transferase [Actinomycetota bacterium]
MLIAGGGTAGHVEPALALAQELRDRGDDVWLLGTREGIESTLAPQRGFQMLPIDRVPLPRRIGWDVLQFPVRQARAVRQARDVIRSHDCEVVVGFGGYVAWPAYVAARRLKVPTVVFSYDAKPGWANRVAARWTRWVATGLPVDGEISQAVHTGVPLRRDIIDLDRGRDRAAAAHALGLDAGRPTLLVFGGSLGATRLNRALIACAAEVTASGWQVLHIVGTRNES